MNKSQSDELDWDFYLYVGETLLGWSRESFFNSTPAHWLKQYILHLKANNPDALEPEKKIHFLDDTPFL